MSFAILRFPIKKCCHGNSSAAALISLKSQSAIKTITFYCYLLQKPGCAQKLTNVHRSCRVGIAISGVLVTTDTAKDLTIILWVESVDEIAREWGRGSGNLYTCTLMQLKSCLHCYFDILFTVFCLKSIVFPQNNSLLCMSSFVMTHISNVMIIKRSLWTKLMKMVTKFRQWPSPTSQKNSKFTPSPLHIALSGQQILW